MEYYSALKGNEILYNMDERWEQYANWHKKVTNRQILYDLAHKKYLEEANSETENRTEVTKG